MFIHPHTFVHPMNVQMSHVCPDTPYAPHAPLCIYVLGASVCDMGMGPPYHWMPLTFIHPSIYVDALNMFRHPLYVHPCPLYICLCPEVSACDMGNTPHMLRSGGICTSVSPLFTVYRLLLTGLVTWMFIMLHVILVAYYVSSLYYLGYDYYSSGDCGVFRYVSFISYHGSLFDGASCHIGSA